MPLIFIHGVATRKSPDYTKEVETRRELLRHYVLEPLAERGDRFKNIEIENPYWGDLAANFRWGQKTLPEVHVLEHLGAGDEGKPASEQVINETVSALAASAPDGALERLGGGDRKLLRAAQANLTRFIEVFLTPLYLSEQRLTDNGEVEPKREGMLQALLARAALDVANDPVVQAGVKAARSDDEVMSLLKEKIEARFGELAESRHAAPGDAGRGLERLGPNWLDDLKARVGEFFDRAVDAPLRIASVATLEAFRGDLHAKVSVFFGDVFVYLSDRGDEENPGPIVTKVGDAIRNAPKHHDDEPLIIITHSMGGNILYDLLTYYATDLRVDVWVSVASQVGQFEELKIFKRRALDIVGPAKIPSLKPALGHWFNVYDPVDVLAFKAAPVFADIDEKADIEYLTGADVLKAHGEYFGRASFYDLLSTLIGGVFA
jgi:hypothetical protein